MLYIFFYFYQILTNFNKLIITSWQLKKIKSIHMFHTLVSVRGESIPEGFNRATKYYGVWQPVPVRYRTREKRGLPLLSLSMRDNERRGMHVPWLSQWWLSLSCLVIATFSFAILYIIVDHFLVIFLLVIVLTVFRFTDADHSFSIILIS